MLVGLVTPAELGPEINPGSHLLTAGIRWLVRAAVPGARFLTVDMLLNRAEHWRAAARCDCLVLCGNPRFSMSRGAAFWENAVWNRLLDAQAAGVRIIDAWAGSAYPFREPMPSPAEMAEEIAAFRHRRHYLGLAAAVPHHITRDPTMQRIYEAAAIPSVLLPCSSWWAAAELGIAPGEPRHDAVLLYRMPGAPGLPGALLAAAERMREELPVRLLAPTLSDAEWAEEEGIAGAELVPDPASLLRVLAQTRRLLSFRVHGAIPAASVGAAVVLVAIDSRAATCAPFGIPAVPFTELAAWRPAFAPGLAPDTELVVRTLRGMLL